MTAPSPPKCDRFVDAWGETVETGLTEAYGWVHPPFGGFARCWEVARLVGNRTAVRATERMLPWEVEVPPAEQEAGK